MEDSTSIDDLPNPAFGGGGGAVQLPAAAQQPHPQIVLPPVAQHAPPQSQQSQVVDPKYMNYIITGIQQTGGSTLGTLPSRDIPMNTLEIQQDELIRANYVPKSAEKRVDFVEEYERRHRPEKTAPKKAAVATATPLFEDFYFPILAAILFFIFQMPAISHMMFKYLKFLHSADGNLTNAGILFKSIIFGGILCGGVYSGVFSWSAP